MIIFLRESPDGHQDQYCGFSVDSFTYFITRPTSGRGGEGQILPSPDFLDILKTTVDIDANFQSGIKLTSFWCKMQTNNAKKTNLFLNIYQ